MIVKTDGSFAALVLPSSMGALYTNSVFRLRKDEYVALKIYEEAFRGSRVSIFSKSNNLLGEWRLINVARNGRQ